MKILKILPLITLTIVVVFSVPGFQKADAASSGPKSGASADFSQRGPACHAFLEKCTERCLGVSSNAVFDDCMNRCSFANKTCQNLGWWWPGGARSAATGAVGEGGVKDPAAGNKLMAGGKGTRPGAATATMPGAVSGAKGVAAAGTAVVSTTGGAAAKSAVIVKRTGVSGGNALRPAGTTTLKIQ